MKGSDHLGVERRMALKYVLRKQNVRVVVWVRESQDKIQ
jgi:hypothetical protein